MNYYNLFTDSRYMYIYGNELIMEKNLIHLLKSSLTLTTFFVD